MYNIISGMLFLIVAAAHLVRASYAWPVQVADWQISVGVSWVAVAVAGAMSIWAFVARKRA